MLGAPLGGLAGLAGLGGAAGAGLGAAASAWKGLGASGGGGSGGSGGGGCGPGGCGGGAGGGADLGVNGGGAGSGVNGASSNRTPGSNRSEALTAAQRVSQIEKNLKEGGVEKGSELKPLAELMGKDDRSFLVKVGSEKCDPCNKWDSSWDSSNKNLFEAKYGYLRVDQYKNPELAKAIKGAAGGEPPGIPAFYRAYKDKDGTLKVEFLQVGADGLMGKIDAAEGKSPHQTQEKITAELAKAKEAQTTESAKITQQKSERTENLTTAEGFMGKDAAHKTSRETFADFNQTGIQDGKKISFQGAIKETDTGYYAKTNENGTRTLLPMNGDKIPEGFTKDNLVSFSSLGLPGKEAGSMKTKAELTSAIEELKANKTEAQTQPSSPTPIQPITQNQTTPTPATPTDLPKSQQISICSGDTCSQHTVNFKASDLNKEINDFADKIYHPTKDEHWNYKDQKLVEDLGKLADSSESRDIKETKFREQINQYEEHHKPKTEE